MKKIYFNEQYCIGCHLCEVYCRLQHSDYGSLLKAFKKQTPPPARSRVEERGELSLSVRCQQCDEPLCLYSCPSGALSRDPQTGAIVHDADKCIGCWTCILACPSGAIRQDLQQAIIVKCDLCAGEEVPACVANCPNEALVFMEAPEGSRHIDNPAAVRIS